MTLDVTMTTSIIQMTT